MDFMTKEIEIIDYLSSTSFDSSDSGVSFNPLLLLKNKKRERSDSSSDDSNTEFYNSPQNVNLNRSGGRGIVIKPVDPSTKCISHATCIRVSHEIREEINHHFTQLPYKEKRNFISSSVLCSKVNNNRPSGKYARKHSNEYHLYWTDGNTGEFHDFIVCRAMFVSTIGITPWTMRNWLGENLALTKDTEKENVKPRKQKRMSRQRSNKKQLIEDQDIKLEKNSCQKFKSVLIERYLNENSNEN